MRTKKFLQIWTGTWGYPHFVRRRNIRTVLWKEML